MSSALQPSDCKEFKVIPPDQYDRDASAADDISKRPLGYMFDSAKYPGVQSGGNLENPCAVLRNLTGRYVEVMVSDSQQFWEGNLCQGQLMVQFRWISVWMAFDGLHVTSWRSCWWTGTMRFFSSGSYLQFSCKLCEQIFFCFVHQHSGDVNHL